MKIFARLILISFFLSVFTNTVQAQTVIQAWATLANSSYPFGIVIDASNNVFTANRHLNTISKITLTGAVTQAWATLASGAGPNSIIIDASGNFYTANNFNSTISKITSTGTVTPAWATLASGAGPYSIAIDAGGNLYTANNNNNTVSKITSTGTVTQAWATLASGAGPTGIAIDGSGNIYTDNYSNNTISMITSTGTVTQAWATLASGAGSLAMVIDASGNLYTSNFGNNTVSKITSLGSVTQAWATLASGSLPYNIAIDASGNLYTANNGNWTVSKITSSGTVTQAWASLTHSSGVGPYGVALDGLGNVYTSNDNSTVTQIFLNNSWRGIAGTNWNTASNWSAGSVPTSSENIIIPVTTNQPLIGNSIFNAACNDININSGATLTINTFLQDNGNTINNGNIAGTGNLVLNGSSAQIISGNGTISNMNINNSSGVTISATSTTQTVTGTITPSAGILTTTNGNVILASSLGNNASIAQGSGSYLSGNVNVQRYVGSSSQWRMIGFPLSSATISEATLSGFYVSGYKAYTYNEGGDNGNYGSSGSTNAGWVQFTSGTIPSTKGILLSGGNIGNKINYTGTINTGTQTIPLSYTSGNTNKGWNLIANPFASPIDWNTIQPNNTSNLDNAIYRYDPNSTAYASFVNGTNAGYQSNVIENGAGFLVHSTGATSLTIQESDKTTSIPLASLFGLQPIVTMNKSIIKLSLSKQGDQYEDEVVLRWGIDPATDNFDGNYDAYDMGRATGPDLSVIGADKTVYSIFHGSALKTNDTENRTVQLGIKNIEQGTYQIAIQLLSAIANSNKAYLFDSYTNQYTLIDGNTNNYNFITTADPKSQSNTRFSIVMNQKIIPDNTNTNYPVALLNNPSTGNLFTLYSKNNYNQLQWQIVDASGRLLQGGLFSNVMKYSTHQINAGNIKHGNYFIKLTGDGNSLPVLKAIKN